MKPDSKGWKAPVVVVGPLLGQPIFAGALPKNHGVAQETAIATDRLVSWPARLATRRYMTRVSPAGIVIVAVDMGGTDSVSLITPDVFKRSRRALSASASHVRMTCEPGVADEILLLNELMIGALAVAVAVGVAVNVLVAVAVAVAVTVFVGVMVRVAVAVLVPVTVGVRVFVAVAVAVGVAVDVGVAVAVALAVLVSVNVADGVIGVGVFKEARVGRGSSACGWQAAAITTINSSVIR